MALVCQARVTAGALKKKRSRSRSKRSRLIRARYRRRRFYAVVVLAYLFFGLGTQTAAILESEDAGPEGSASKAENAGSPGFIPAAFEGLLAQGDSGTTTADEAPSPVRKDTQDLAASGKRESINEAEKRAERREALEARKEARKEARLEAKREARQEKARQEEARQAATREAEQASGDPLDVLVLGVDKRPSATEDTSTRSDTIMLVRVVPATGMVKLLSVPRDLYVEVESGKKSRVNAAYAYGGVDQARTVMEDLTGIEIDNYVIVDFEGFEQVIDAMGGVRVDVGSGVFPEHWNMGEGMERLNGYKALKYARYRGTPRADLDRIDHQQKLLAALRRQALRWNIITKLPGIIKVTNENVDTDLGVLQVIPLARALVLNGEDNRMVTSELEGYPESLSDGEQVLIPAEKANEEILEDFRE
jgi:polyisoprenyl-teichoic acid--peptidoglycan teichoic acid transferase